MGSKLIFDKKNILVLGGAGFIGSHLMDFLVKESKIICIDNFSSGSERNIDHLLSNSNFRFIKHDMALPIILEDYSELADFKVEFQGIQEIYNLACPTSPKDFAKNRLANVLANSYVVKNGLDLALRYQAKYLHFSSSVVYGQRSSNEKRVMESEEGAVDQLSDRASYDEGKRFAETMIKTYHDIFEIDAKIARIFRIYGPRMPLEEGHMIPDFITNAMDNKDLFIYGDANFSTSLCYIDDCISGVVKLMSSDLFGPVNIGSDIDIKIIDVANKIIADTGSSSQVVLADPLLFMTPLALPDITLAREALTWMPLVTVENGLRKTIKDLEANRGVKGMEV
ncbi:MAG: NAD-dependent epimerase/dehydratase family protein [Candidatus Falkowbacteria bacterium]